MIITLCQEKNHFCRDIKVNREQKIMETLFIMFDGGIISERVDPSINRIFSTRQNEYIDMEKTYEQENIFNGDILSII